MYNLQSFLNYIPLELQQKIADKQRFLVIEKKIYNLLLTISNLSILQELSKDIEKNAEIIVYLMALDEIAAGQISIQLIQKESGSVTYLEYQSKKTTLSHWEIQNEHTAKNWQLALYEWIRSFTL